MDRVAPRAMLLLLLEAVVEVEVVVAVGVEEGVSLVAPADRLRRPLLLLLLLEGVLTAGADSPLEEVFVVAAGD